MGVASAVFRFTTDAVIVVVEVEDVRTGDRHHSSKVRAVHVRACYEPCRRYGARGRVDYLRRNGRYFGARHHEEGWETGDRDKGLR